MAKKEDLELQKKIAEAVKNMSSSLANYADAQKVVAENWKLIKALNEEIANLTNENGDALSDLTDEQKTQLENLKQQKALYIGVNKEMGKSKNLLKSIGNSIVENLKNQGALVDNIVNGYDQMDQSVRSISMTMGLNNTRMGQFRANVASVASDMALLGISAQEVAQAQGAFAEETGRSVLLSGEVMKRFGDLGRETGLGMENISQMAGQMEAFGLSANESANVISSVQDMSQKMGINTGKVLKKFQQNLSLVNKLSFKDGVKGMAKMAAHSEKYKLSMEAVAGMAEQVFRPEGAIEAAANLQVLGGSLSQLGDPFQLMYKARYAPEELAKSISNAAAQSAELNKEGTEFVVGAMELDRLREASQATGISVEELVQTAKQTKKMKFFEGTFADLSDEEKNLLAGAAEMEGGKLMIDGKEVTKENRKDLLERLKLQEKQAEDAMTSMQLLGNLKNVLMSSLYPAIKELDDSLGPIIKDMGIWVKDSLVPVIKEWTTGWKKWVVLAGGLAIKFGGVIADWIQRGFWLAKGFKIGTKGWGVGGGQSGVTEMVTSKSGKKYAADSPQGKMIKNMTKGGGKGTGGTDSMGKQVGSMKGAMAGAAKTAIQMIAFAAAMYILAEAFAVFSSDVSWDGVGRGVVAIGAFTGAMYLLNPALKGLEKSWGGIAAMTALAGSMVLLGLSAMMFAAGGTAGIIGMAVGLGVLTAAVLALGLLGTAGIGWVGVAMVLALGAAMLALGYAVKLAAEGFSMVVDSFTNMFSVINADNIGPLLMLGPALMMTSLGIMALAASLVLLGVAFLAGGFLGLMALSSTAETLQNAFGNMDSDNMVKAINAINNVDMDKVNALKELSAMMSMMGILGAKPIELVMTVDGDIDIKGEGGGKKSTDWVNDPIFVSKLKDIIWEEMDKGRNGGKS